MQNIEPDLNYLLHRLKNNILDTINCIKIGKVVKFYPESKSVDIQILDNTQEYPLLSKCFVLFYKITQPIKPGDIGVVLFNDTNTESFYNTNDMKTDYGDRSHDINDGIVILGLNSLANVLYGDGGNYDENNIHLRGDSRVSGDLLIDKNINVNININVKGNIEGATYSTNGEAGATGTFQDTGESASYKTLTIKNGLITNIG